jgi:hypothetical protein
LAVFFTRLFDTYLDIVSASREELHQSLGGKRAGTPRMRSETLDSRQP